MIWPVIGLMLLIGAAEWLSLKVLPTYIRAETKPETNRTEPGAPLVLETTLQNRSLLPATLLAVTERIPAAATVPGQILPDESSVTDTFIKAGSGQKSARQVKAKAETTSARYTETGATESSARDTETGAAESSVLDTETGATESSVEKSASAGNTDTDVGGPGVSDVADIAQTERSEQYGTTLFRDVTGSRLSWKTWLLPRQRLKKRTEVRLSQRGRFLFRGSSVFVGDFAGLKGTTRAFERQEEVIVYPAPAVSVPELEEMIGSWLGDRSVRRFILEDPMLTMGVADYTGREPLRSINWKQSARGMKTLVNQYDHTAELTAAVVLNLEYTARYARDELALEHAFSCTRSVLEELERRGMRYSFYSNMLTAGALGEWRYVPEGQGDVHLHGILEGLGRATYDTGESAEVLLARVLRHAVQSHAQVVIISPVSCCKDSREGEFSDRRPVRAMSAEDAVNGRWNAGFFEKHEFRTRETEGNRGLADAQKRRHEAFREMLLLYARKIEDLTGCPAAVLTVDAETVERWM